MDVTQCLIEALELMYECSDDDDRAALVDKLEDLADWIRKGGALPLVYSEMRVGGTPNANVNMVFDDPNVKHFYVDNRELRQ